MTINDYSNRIRYLLIIIVLVILGITSRKLAFVPVFVGDFLWAVNLFFMIAFLFSRLSINKVVFLSLVTSYLIEISQLYQSPWNDKIRQTTIGHLVLGRGFLLSDILSYSLGIIMAGFFCYIIQTKAEPKKLINP